MTRALRTTAADLGAALGSVAMQAAQARMERRAPATLHAMIHCGAHALLARRDRLQRLARVVYFWNSWAEPRPIAEMLAEAEARVAWLEKLGRDGDHRLYDFNRHIAMRQARLALQWLRLAEIATRPANDLAPLVGGA